MARPRPPHPTVETDRRARRASLVFLICADELFLSGNTFELNVERAILLAEIMAKGFEIRRRLPPVDRQPPSVRAERLEQSCSTIAFGPLEQLGPPAAARIGFMELLLAALRRSEFPDTEMGHAQRPRLGRSPQRWCPGEDSNLHALASAST